VTGMANAYSRTWAKSVGEGVFGLRRASVLAGAKTLSFARATQGRSHTAFRESADDFQFAYPKIENE